MAVIKFDVEVIILRVLAESQFLKVMNIIFANGTHLFIWFVVTIRAVAQMKAPWNNSCWFWVAANTHLGQTRITQLGLAWLFCEGKSGVPVNYCISQRTTESEAELF